MKAITIWQPWASLLVCGEKKYETRSWATSYRGPIAIHAAKVAPSTVMRKLFPLGDWSYSPDYQAKKDLLKELGSAFEDYAPIEDVEEFLAELPLGCVIATAELVGCHEIVLHGGRGLSSASPGWLETENGIYEPTDRELMFGNWTPRRYAWELANMKIIDPIEVAGKQRLWEWSGM